MSNKRIVFIGDSLTRYQYLNLILFFQRNSWVTNNFPAVEDEKAWASWRSFHMGSSFRFGCQEICDCYRLNDNFDSARENRYFFDEHNNLTIDMYLWFPPRPIRLGHRNTTNFREVCSNPELFTEMVKSYSQGNDTVYEIVEFLNTIISNSYPDILIINQGFWSFPSLDGNLTFQNIFISTIKRIAGQAIWKTTTAPCYPGSTTVKGETFLSNLRMGGIRIFDAYSYTREVVALNNETTRNVCWDGLHFQPFVYRELNKRLLSFILQNDTTR